MAYPLLSNLLLERESQAEISAYASLACSQEAAQIQGEIDKARAYNRHPVAEDYQSILWCDDLGMIGYLTIPVIDLQVPIYHGASGLVLEKGIGHVQDSDFPVGQTGTHAVLAGHTGMQGARLFTDLPSVEEGDMFYVTVYDQTRSYQVTSIRVVLPEATNELLPQADKELVTLVTCTPYGVNSHRLLVTGTFAGMVDLEQVMEAGQERENKYASLWLGKYKQAILIGVLPSVGLACVIWIFRRRKVNG